MDEILTRQFEVYIRTAVDILNITSQPLITLTLTLKLKRVLNVVPETLTLR